MKPRIAIDARMVTPKLHGFARYVSLLARGLADLPKSVGELEYDPVFLVDPTIANLNLIPIEFETVGVKAGFLSPKELVEIPKVIRRLRASLYHSPTFSSLAKCPVPWLVTIHDLNHLRYGNMKQKFYYETLLKRFARGARSVMTVSDFSRKEIAAWSGIPADKIEVVHNAVAESLLAPIAESEITEVLGKHGLKKGRYFFCLSNPKPHKNVPLLLDAYEGSCAHESDWPLVLSMNAMREAAGLRWLGSLEEREARCLLKAAGALAFPSEYEGFGLPPVEAAAMGGIPLLVSKIPAHQEALVDLGPDEVCWLSPGDCHAWERALTRVISGEIPGVSRATQGKVRTRYSAGNLGTHMDRIYRRVLGLSQ